MDNKEDKSKPRKYTSRQHKPDDRKDGSKAMGALLTNQGSRSNNTGKTADAMTKSSTQKTGEQSDKKILRQMTIVDEEDAGSKRETFGADQKTKKKLKLKIPSTDYENKGKRSQSQPEYDTP